MTRNDEQPKKAEQDTLAARVADALALAPQRVHAEREDGRYGACHTCGQRTHLFDDLECGGCKDDAYLAEWQGYAGTLGTLVRDLAAALAAAGAREARLAEERDAYRQALTYWANMGTNYRGAITPDMIDDAMEPTNTVTQAYGCADCAGKTLDDGLVSCWTCGRAMPAALEADHA